jgi:hypothetical protein
MAIQRTDLVYCRSAVWNDTASNGGEMSTTTIVDAVSGNIFPTVNQAERIAGSTKYKKVFVKNKEGTGLTLYNAKIYIENPTPANDIVVLQAGTLTDAQSAISGRLYGCGWLNAAAAIGDTSITVLTEDGDIPIFAVSDSLRISNKANVDDVAGVEEYVTISTVTYSGDVATITFTPALENSFIATNKATRISSMLSLGDIVATATTPVLVSTNGTYDGVTYPIVTNNIGTVRQNWTLTFTNATSFNIVGDTLGNIGSGTVGSGADPYNPLLSSPYFTLSPNGFSGALASGNTITFSTSPSAKAVWFKRIVPANTASYTGNSFTVTIEGESE